MDTNEAADSSRDETIASLQSANSALAELLATARDDIADLTRRVAGLEPPVIVTEPTDCLTEGVVCSIHVTASGLEPGSSIRVAFSTDDEVERGSTTAVVGPDGTFETTWRPSSTSFSPFVGDYVTVTGTGANGQPVSYDSRTP